METQTVSSARASAPVSREQVETVPAAPAQAPVATADSVRGAPIEGPAYQAESATTKRDRLWRAISETPYATLPPLEGQGITSKGIVDTIRILWNRALLAQAFDVAEDVRPDREKIFHPFGTAARVRFEPDANTPHTGIFRSGAAGIARLSLGADDKQYISGIAVKLFVDGKPSVNLHAIPGLDAQESRDFFANAPSTTIPKPTDAKFKFANLFLARVANPTKRGVSALANTDTRGNRIANPSSPEGVTFVPARGVNFSPTTTRDFRDELGDLRPGTVIYEVYSTETPPKRLGAIRLESSFVASAFEDRRLSFEHQR